MDGLRSIHTGQRCRPVYIHTSERSWPRHGPVSTRSSVFLNGYTCLSCIVYADRLSTMPLSLQDITTPSYSTFITQRPSRRWLRWLRSIRIRSIPPSDTSFQRFLSLLQVRDTSVAATTSSLSLHLALHETSPNGSPSPTRRRIYVR